MVKNRLMAQQEATVEAFDFSSTMTPMMNMFMMMFMLAAVTTIVPAISAIQQGTSTGTSAQGISAQGISAQGQLQGKIDSRSLNAIGTIQWLNLALENKYWWSADIINRGNAQAYIGINTPGPWTPLAPGDSFPVNLTGSQRPIDCIFYYCDPGNVVPLQVVGRY